MRRMMFAITGFALLAVGTHPSLSQTSSMWFTAYYPTWMQAPLNYNGYAQPPWEIDWTGVTHVVHFDNGNVQTTSPYFTYVVNDLQGISDSVNLFFSGISNPQCGPPCWTVNYVDSLIAIAHRRSIKVLLTIQAVDAANLNFVADDSVRTEVFSAAAVGFAKRHGYDGLEIDWEGWLTPITTPANVNRFIRLLRKRLNTMNPRGLLFLSPSSTHADLYWPSQDSLVDMFNLQLYDYGFAWNPNLGANASWYIAPLHRGVAPANFEGQAYDTRGPLQWVAYGHQASRTGALLPTLGLVYKGVDTTLQNYSNNFASDLNAQAVKNLTSVGGVLGWDDVRKVPYVRGTTTAIVPWPISLISGQKFFGTFENDQSLREKVLWLRSIGIGGVGMYDLKGDSDPTKPFGQRNPLHKAVLTALVASVVRIGNEIPKGFGLEQNYPNPFNPVTRIHYDLPMASNVTLKVFNIQGQIVAVLVNGYQDFGTYVVEFDASHLSSGVYFYTLDTGSFSQARKMLLIR